MSMVKESLDDWYMYVGVPVRKIKARKRKIVELENELLKTSIHESLKDNAANYLKEINKDMCV